MSKKKFPRSSNRVTRRWQYKRIELVLPMVQTRIIIRFKNEKQRLSHILTLNTVGNRLISNILCSFHLCRKLLKFANVSCVLYLTVIEENI